MRKYHAREPGFGLSDVIMIEEQSGRVEEARDIAKQLMAARPNFTIASWLKTQFRNDTQRMEADLASLRAAGVARKIVGKSGCGTSRTRQCQQDRSAVGCEADYRQRRWNGSV